MTLFNDLAVKRFLSSEFRNMARTPRRFLLDLGCGTRPYFQLYEDLFDRCICADYERRGPIHIRLDAVNLPFREASFDVVLMAEVLEHVAEADSVLREIERVLKPGGVLLITWPFNYMLHEIPSDRHRFTEFDMQSRINQTGMQVELLYRRGNALILGAVLVEFYISGALTLLSRLPLLGKALGKMLSPLFSVFYFTFYQIYLSLTWRRTYLNAPGIGRGLDGLRGHLSLWTLGYCARVRKPGGLA